MSQALKSPKSDVLVSASNEFPSVDKIIIWKKKRKKGKKSVLVGIINEYGIALLLFFLLKFVFRNDSIPTEERRKF